MRTGWCAALAVLIYSLCGAAGAAASNASQRALDDALAGTDAVAVVLDAQDSRLIAAVREEEAGQRASAPGSTLKPFFLAAALRQGRVGAETTVVCHGNLRIGGRDVACTHPRDVNVLDAEQALAYSCNTWFASLARRFAPRDAVEVLRTYGFGNQTGLVSGEGPGVLQTPRNDAEVQLLVLGLSDIRVTPAQLARAYFRLGQQLEQMPVVRKGLEGSVAFGMAHNASTAG